MSKISSAAFADTKPHYDILDGLRGVAAIMVVWFHLFEAYATSHLDQRINHGYLAVDFFFILSGFVIGYAYDDRWKKKMSVKDFLKRRLIRLHPMVVMGAVIGAVMFYFQGCSVWDVSAVSLSMLLTATLLNALLIPATPGSEIRGDLVAYMLYVSTLIATIRRIIEFAEQFQRGMTGIERFLQIVDADIEIFDEPDAIELKDPKGEISFEKVSFEYPDDHNKVFTDLNLQIHAGEKVAIVGPSGGGKTTLCNLIPRFYDVSEGRILLDGQDIKHFTLKSLRGNIGIVQQDVYLFSGTIYENIAYGRPGASKEDVINAAKRAGAHEFIMGLKDGYDTYVGERGVKLSGGQKQRISIARVFLKNPPIIILDEATSALDNESEFAVAKSLGELSEGRTTLTIAHRLSSIRNSDRILVLTDDGIVEEGNHDQLMEQKGIYYQFYETANALK